MDCPSYLIELSSTTGTYRLSIEDAKALAIELDKATAQAEAVRDFAQDLIDMSEHHSSEFVLNSLKGKYTDDYS